MKNNRVTIAWNLVSNMIRYNLRIIFANKFIWFLVSSIVVYAGLSLINVLQQSVTNVEDMYTIFMLSGVLLVFYPTVFGIQNDQDAKTIEILFGIPNYRYKVWLVRFVLIYIITFLIILSFTAVSSALITALPVMNMTLQSMFPVVFLGTMAFFLSTLIRNGYGTAVVMIILGILLMVFSNTLLQNTLWNPYLNPFESPSNISDFAWSVTTRDNRIFMGVSTLLFLLGALYMLRRREKFM